MNATAGSRTGSKARRKDGNGRIRVAGWLGPWSFLFSSSFRDRWEGKFGDAMTLQLGDVSWLWL